MAPSILLAISIGQFHTESPAGVFTTAEADRLVAYWNQPDRMRSEDINPQQPYRALYSHAASIWLYNLYKKRDPNQPLIPTKAVTPRLPRHREWDAIIDTQYSQDFAYAESVAAWMNQDLSSIPASIPISRPVSPLPADLIATAGTPPTFFVVHRPQKITVLLDSYLGVFNEGVDVPRKYPFLRSTIGSVSSSTPPTQFELNSLATTAGMPTILVKPLMAVASLEGGFDTINTYDTGGISLGIIQFASLSSGRGSLAALLQTYRSRQPAEFSANFRRYGVDVAPDGRLTVIDPRTGFENSGADAVRVIVDDKRLTAVFQRVSKLSPNFRATQLRLLSASYNPLRLTIPVTLGTSTVAVPIGQIFKSEAGLATLMDRLVNRGSIEPLPSIVSKLASQNNITTISGLSSLEHQIIEQVTYRNNFLALSSLSEPSSSSISQISGNPTGAPNTRGSIGRTDFASAAPTQVPPFDPTRAGNVTAPNSPQPAAESTTAPAVIRDPIPSKPAGPITIPGG